MREGQKCPSQKGERMTQGELNLYRNTFEDGKRTGIREFAERIKQEIKSKDTVMIFKDNIQEIIDKHLKEALEACGQTRKEKQ